MSSLFNNNTFTIFRREIRAQVLTRAFIMSTVIVPFLMVGAMSIQYFLATYEDDKPINLRIVVEDRQQATLLNDKIAAREADNYRFTVHTLEAGTFEEALAEAKPALLDEELDGMVYLPSSNTKKLEYYSANPGNRNITGEASGLVEQALIAGRFRDRQLEQGDLDFLTSAIEVDTFKVTTADGVQSDGYGALVLAGILAFLLYFSLVMMGMRMMHAVIEEKENRIVEVLLSSVKSGELMAGKVAGTASAGLLQIVVWMLPFLLLSLGGATAFLPEGSSFHVDPGTVFYFIANYAIGLGTYLCLYATVGSVCNNVREAQQASAPVMFLIMIPFYICFTLGMNPANSIAEVASLMPFASIMVMPVRMAVIDVPGWQIMTALAINLTTLFVITRSVGKVYRIGIMGTGQPASFRNIVRWMRYA